jgi:hypothetical protein
MMNPVFWFSFASWFLKGSCMRLFLLFYVHTRIVILVVVASLKTSLKSSFQIPHCCFQITYLLTSHIYVSNAFVCECLCVCVLVCVCVNFFNNVIIFTVNCFFFLLSPSRKNDSLKCWLCVWLIIALYRGWFLFIPGSW